MSILCFYKTDSDAFYYQSTSVKIRKFTFALLPTTFNDIGSSGFPAPYYLKHLSSSTFSLICHKLCLLWGFNVKVPPVLSVKFWNVQFKRSRWMNVLTAVFLLAPALVFPAIQGAAGRYNNQLRAGWHKNCYILFVGK